MDWRPSSRVDYTERRKTERKKENVPNQPALRKKAIKIRRGGGGGGSPLPFPPKKKKGEKGDGEEGEGEEGGGGGMILILKVKYPPHTPLSFLR